MTTTRLLSWGNHPPHPQVAKACHARGRLAEGFVLVREHEGTTLPFGSGLSYGDSCLAASDHVLHMRTLDCFIDADWINGRITAESGVSLEDVLALAIPRGWFLPVTPGTKYVTLGGAVANDVHGKNHHRRGTFGRYVRRFGLMRSDTGRHTCSPTENVELFNATIGGLGLTGLIEWAEVQLMPIRASRIVGVTQRFGTLDDYFALAAELDEQHEFCVSWIDCLASGKASGRGIYSAGDFASQGELAVETAAKRTIPLTPPISLINGLSLRAFNELYWRKASTKRKTVEVGYDSYLYPLDALLKWNRIYGRKGFQQYQCVIPERSARDAVRALLDAISASRTGSFLAVLKRCGDAQSPGILSFPMAGTTLALDFPHSDWLDADLFPRLDAIVREAKGRIYPAKDAHMKGEDFRSAYPEWAKVEALRDPALLSRFWKRVTQ